MSGERVGGVQYEMIVNALAKLDEITEKQGELIGQLKLDLKRANDAWKVLADDVYARDGDVRELLGDVRELQARLIALAR